MPVADEFRAGNRGHFSNYVISLQESLLETTAAVQFSSDWSKLKPNSSGEALAIDQAAISDLRMLLDTITQSAQGSQQAIHTDSIRVELADRIIRCLLTARDVNARRRTLNRRGYLKAAQDFIDNNVQSLTTVSDICKAIDVSERTLEYAFKEQMNMTPKAYLNCQRLASVRREIISPENTGGRIVDFASYYGYWHMGHFARDYRRIYGENPSETLARTRALTENLTSEFDEERS